MRIQQINLASTKDLPLWVVEEIEKDPELRQHLNTLLQDGHNYTGRKLQSIDVVNSVAYFYFKRSCRST